MSLRCSSYLVTGSTDGIGEHTATRLAQQGATVLIHGRSAAKVEAAVQRLRQQYSASGAVIHGYTADLSSLASVRQLASKVREQHPVLTTLINNAGVFEPARKQSADGYEMTWAVNVLAPFLLTSLLLPTVSDRVVNTASISAASSIDWVNLQQEKGYSSHDAYSLSKLCNIVFTFALARRLGRPKPTVNTLDPGTVNTKMLKAGWGSWGIDVATANNTLKVATDPGLSQVTGKYYVGGSEARAPSPASDTGVQERLWKLWEQQTGADWSSLKG